VNWTHEISLLALAAAVATLGLVMLLELRCVVRLRRALDCNLGRVFEQLDLLRFENQQLLEAQSHTHVRMVRSAPARAAASESLPSETRTGANSAAGAAAVKAVAVTAAMNEAALNPPALNAQPQSVQAGGLGAGEARLLASLAAARIRRTQERSVEIQAAAASAAAAMPADLTAGAARSRGSKISRLV